MPGSIELNSVFIKGEMR